MGTQWGVDSCERADHTPYSGCGLSNQTLAWYVKNCYFKYPPPADNIIFWARYFSPSQCGVFDLESHPGLEVQAMRAQAIYSIMPVTIPTDVNNGTASQGTADGNAVCQAVTNMIFGGVDDGTCVTFPSTNAIYLYLDVEAGINLTAAYWGAWNNAVWNFRTPDGRYPYWPGIYTNANGSVCSVVASGPHAGNVKVWSNQPDPGCSGSYCSSPGPSWGPYGCSGITTSMWQYGIYNPNNCSRTCCCYSGFPPVDLDQSNPGTTETNYMLATC